VGVGGGGGGQAESVLSPVTPAGAAGAAGGAMERVEDRGRVPRAGQVENKLFPSVATAGRQLDHVLNAGGGRSGGRSGGGVGGRDRDTGIGVDSGIGGGVSSLTGDFKGFKGPLNAGEAEKRAARAAGRRDARDARDALGGGAAAGAAAGSAAGSVAGSARGSVGGGDVSAASAYSGGDSGGDSGGVDGGLRPAPAMVKMPMGPPDQPSPAASLKYVRSYETTPCRVTPCTVNVTHIDAILTHHDSCLSIFRHSPSMNTSCLHIHRYYEQVGDESGGLSTNIGYLSPSSSF
jgi:hypothetical protein